MRMIKNKRPTIAGIVLYNPDINRLLDNIQNIFPQVDCLILVENGSKDLSYLDKLKEYKGILIVKNRGNMGIAYALNQILGYAYSHGYQWALTLDQDSVVTDNFISTYKDIATDEMGILGCWCDDRNFKWDETHNIKRGTFENPWCITSGSFTNTKAWKECGGFDTGMFIDWVDWEICLSMKNAGYKIYKTFKTKLIHEAGKNTRLVKVRHHIMQVLNQPVFRNYYYYRNRIYIARKYNDISIRSQLKENLFRFYVTLRYEGNIVSNIGAFLRGSIAGFRAKISYNSITEDFYNIQCERI